MSTKKANPKKAVHKKGLTDEEFIKKYEAGAVDLLPILNKGMSKLENHKTTKETKSK